MASPPPTAPALGLSIHTGWAVAVLTDATSGVAHRHRLTLCDEALPRMAYHACEGLSLDEARELVDAVVESAHAEAHREVAALVAQGRDAGAPVTTAAIVGTDPVSVPEDLATILSSHRLIHAGEGALFKRALAGACRDGGLDTTYLPPKQLDGEASRALGMDTGELRSLVTRTGKALGPPWQADHKQAFLAALVAGAPPGS